MKRALSLIVFTIVFTLFLFSCQSYLVKDADTTLVLEDTILEDEEVPPVVEMPSSEVQQESAVPESLSATTTHYVSFTSKGFEPTRLTIKAGDTIIWKNERVKDSALLLGSQSCKFIKSGMLAPGEEFSWTFDSAISCPFVDGIFVSTVMYINVG